MKFNHLGMNDLCFTLIITDPVVMYILYITKNACYQDLSL